MSIEIQLRHRKPRDETRQIAFVEASGFNEHVYQFHIGNVPVELDTDEAIQEWLDARIDKWHLFCLKKTWIGADISPFRIEGKSELEAFLDWVDDGHRNIIGYDEEENPVYEVISNHLYAGTHPHAIEWLEAMEGAEGWSQGKTVLLQMIKDMI